MTDSAPKRKREYTGKKATKDTSSLLSRLILFVQLADKQGKAVTTTDFRTSEGDISGEKTITLAIKKGYITLTRKGNQRVIKLGEKAGEVATLIGLLGNDSDAVKE